MIESRHFSKSLRLLIGLACFGVAVFALQPFVSLFNSTFLALIIVLSVAPVPQWLRAKGLPNWVAFLLTLFAIIAVVTFVTVVTVVTIIAVIDVVIIVVAIIAVIDVVIIVGG